MDKKDVITKQKRNNVLFSTLALKFNDDINVSSEIMSVLSCVKTELRTYILLLILDEFKNAIYNSASHPINEEKLIKNTNYVLLIIFINSGIRLSQKFPDLFPKITCVSLEFRYLISFFIRKENHFVRELFHYLLVIKSNKRKITTTRTFSLILENIIIKMGGNLLDLYFRQRKYNLQVLTHQTNSYGYLEIRSKHFIKHIYWILCIRENLLKVKDLHNNTYPILTIIDHAIDSKRIVYPRFQEINTLSNRQNILLFYLEVIDLITIKFIILHSKNHS